ncbi:hypothetical protein Tco_1115537 [Tanacetum coccineum]
MLAVPTPPASFSNSISSPEPTPTQPSPTQPSPQPSPIQPSPTQPSPIQPDTEYHLPTPHDSPLHVVHSYGSEEGSLKLQELMNLVNTLSDRIGVLEADLLKTKKTYSSAYTKLILRVKKLEKRASTETELFIQEVTPTEVIHEQEGSGKASDEVSTAGKKKGTASEEVPTFKPMKKSKKELEQERLSYAEAIRLEEQMNEEQRAQIARDAKIASPWHKKKERAMDEAKTYKEID